jgi:hypothetical protein
VAYLPNDTYQDQEHQNDAIADLRLRCQEEFKDFDESFFGHFISESILPDPLLLNCFLLTYPIGGRAYTQGNLYYVNKLKKEKMLVVLADKFFEMHQEWTPYSNFFEEDFLKIRMTLGKIGAGDPRSIDEIYVDSLPKEKEISKGEETVLLTVFRNEPFMRDNMLRNIRYELPVGEKWIREHHWFGIDHDDEVEKENVMHEILRRRFSEPKSIFPERTEDEIVVCFHKRNLERGLSWEAIEEVCGNTKGLPFAWGPKFTNLLNKKIKFVIERVPDFAYRPLNPSSVHKDSKAATPSRYPEQYWATVERIDEAAGIVRSHFLGTISKMREEDGIDTRAIVSWLETVLHRDIGKEIEKEEKYLKNRSAPFFQDPEGILRSDRDSVDLEPGTPGFYFDFDELFSDEKEIFTARNINNENITKIGADRFNISLRRAQQIKVKVIEILVREARERHKYFLYWLEEVKNATLKVYRKPYHQTKPAQKKNYNS